MALALQSVQFLQSGLGAGAASAEVAATIGDTRARISGCTFPAWQRERRDFGCTLRALRKGESMDSFTVKVEQMIARELRVARGWLIAVAVLTFAQQMLYAFNLPPKLQGKQQLYVIIACAQFAVFLGLWLLAHKKPKHSLILALVVFWVLQLGLIVMSPLEASLGVFPIILRLAFTLALIGGISATRAEEMARNRQTPETAEAPDGG
jgi:hypothetical protein